MLVQVIDPVATDLRDARARTLQLCAGLSDEQWLGPRLEIVNPLLWEAGHLAWFQEYWTLRHARGKAPLVAEGDALYDSARVAHHTRWSLPLLPRARVLGYLAETLVRSLAALETASEEQRYFHRLALCHEDMHGEAFTYTRQTLGHPAPPRAAEAGVASLEETAALPETAAGALPGDAEIPGARFLLGAVPAAEAFVFDNEKWAHPVEVETFRLARAPVTNAEYAEFVEAGGYRQDRFWSEAGRAWLLRSGQERPVYWEPGFRERRYDRVVPLLPHAPVVHVCWYEAEAYCAWAGRRLPTEAEWELAAGTPGKRRFPWGDAPPGPGHANLDARRGGPVDVAAHPQGDSADGCRQLIGNVWEWTATRFAAYPGFIADPYKEYSEPWFATPHYVLRGGCWATRGRLLRNTWRNFYPPDRGDVLAGFRTCAR